jgi:hypothetical protein
MSSAALAPVRVRPLRDKLFILFTHLFPPFINRAGAPGVAPGTPLVLLSRQPGLCALAEAQQKTAVPSSLLSLII